MGADELGELSHERTAANEKVMKRGEFGGIYAGFLPHRPFQKKHRLEGNDSSQMKRDGIDRTKRGQMSGH